MIIKKLSSRKKFIFHFIVSSKQSVKNLKIFFLFERPKNTWSVTFLILKYFTTRHEVFYSNVDNFQISKSTPEFNITQMIL